MLRGFYSNVRHLVQMRHVVLLALAMCCASVIVTTLPSHAGASSLPGNQTVATPITPLVQFAAPGENTTTTQDGQEITCVGGPLGYITCPLIDITSGTIKFIAAFLDVIFNFQALSNDAMRSAWGVFVNLANIMIGIAFLIIIMSQATSMGISSYGIKRTLPRIVAAVILINMSFYVCAFAIDVSNVLGHNMMSFVSSLSEGIESPPTSSSESSEEQSSCSKVGGVIGGAIGGIVGTVGGPAGSVVGAAGGAFFGNKVGCTIGLIAGGLMGGITIITVIIAVGLVAIFIAFITTLALAIIRYVLLIFLVVLAPLAFAAWVLPNTEKFFQKWWGMFSKLLMIYPAVMFMFGASMFAADIVGSVLGNGEFIKDLFPESGAITADAVKAVWAVVQLFIIAMPLFFIPAMFKGMDSITGGIAGKIMNAQRRVGNAAKSGAKSGLKAGAKKAAPYAKAAGLMALDKAGQGNGRLGSFIRRTRAKDRAIKQALAARKAGAQDEISEEATKVGMNSPRLRSLGGDRYDRYIGSEAAAGEKKKVEATIAAATSSGAADDLKGIASAFESAVRSGDSVGIKANAHILANGGAKGKDYLAEKLRSLDGQTLSHDTGTALNDALKSSYGDLVKGRADVAKSFAEPTQDGRSVFKMGDISSLSAEQLAQQQASTIHDNIRRGVVIDQKVAHDVVMSSTLTTTGSQTDYMLEAIARNDTDTLRRLQGTTTLEEVPKAKPTSSLPEATRLIDPRTGKPF